jgi:hypothetical protein
MNELDNILSELAGSKLLYILKENNKFIFRFNNGRESKVITISSEGENSKPVLEFKSIKVS